MVVLLTCKNEEDSIKNRVARVFTTLYINFSDAQGQITLELVAVQNLMHPFPLPNDASDKIWLRLAHWLRRYSSLKMFTDRQTARQTDDGSTGIL